MTSDRAKHRLMPRSSGTGRRWIPKTLLTLLLLGGAGLVLTLLLFLDDAGLWDWRFLRNRDGEPRSLRQAIAALFQGRGE